MTEDTMNDTSTALLPHSRLTEILGAREAALASIREALSHMETAQAHVEQAMEYAVTARQDDRFHENDRRQEPAWQRLVAPIDRDASYEAFRRELDASVWVHIVRVTGMEALMDQTARDRFLKDLAGDVPEVTEDNVRATMEALAADSHLIFGRGLARVFSELDRRFRSHDGFKIGSRIILTYIFDGDGHLNYRVGEKLADVERVFSVLDGRKGHGVGETVAAIREDRGHSWGARQSLTETAYFRARAFKNGNLHLWFTRDDLVRQANQVLANYYGEVLPDGVPGHDDVLRSRSKTTAVSRDLAFYPTPKKVVEAMLRETYLRPGCTVLEPSAGTGNIARVALDAGAQVTAVEVDVGRAAALRGIGHPDLTVRHANFLDMPAAPVFSHVLMNPPFYGRHWMSHVMHAYEFLAPGGVLIAVLPVAAELGESKEHDAFREWAKDRALRGWRGLFEELPQESFAASGTRVSTVILRLGRAR